MRLIANLCVLMLVCGMASAAVAPMSPLVKKEATLN
jgi:hypothetical protein